MKFFILIFFSYFCSYSDTSAQTEGCVKLAKVTVRGQCGDVEGFGFIVRETSCREIEQFITNELNPNGFSALLKKKDNKASVEKFSNGVNITNAVIPSISSRAVDIMMRLEPRNEHVAVMLAFVHGDTAITNATFPKEYEAVRNYVRQVGVKANTEVVARQLSNSEDVLKDLLKERERTRLSITEYRQCIDDCKAVLKSIEHERNIEQQFVEQQTATVLHLKSKLRALVKNSQDAKQLNEQVRKEERRLKKAKNNLSKLQNNITGECKKINALEKEKQEKERYFRELTDPKSQERNITTIKEKLNNIK
ncbi:MAG: hypothetical protein ACK5L5_05750 [Bacteroidales bacterium]